VDSYSRRLVVKCVLLFIGAILLVGCATEGKLRYKMQSWVGAPEAKLVESWGPPTNVYDQGGVRYLSYTRTGSVVIPGTDPSYSISGASGVYTATPYGGTPDVAMSVWCTASFQVKDGKIVSFRYEGNSCTSQ
jgi:hypothetical protein